MTAADLHGLRRRDAAVLIAVCLQPGERPPQSFLRRLSFLLRWRPSAALGRLEARGLVEPGWSVSLRRPRAVEAVPTSEGRRVARAAVVTLSLE